MSLYEMNQICLTPIYSVRWDNIRKLSAQAKRLQIRGNIIKRIKMTPSYTLTKWLSPRCSSWNKVSFVLNGLPIQTMGYSSISAHSILFCHTQTLTPTPANNNVMEMGVIISNTNWLEPGGNHAQSEATMPSSVPSRSPFTPSRSLFYISTSLRMAGIRWALKPPITALFGL